MDWESLWGNLPWSDRRRAPETRLIEPPDDLDYRDSKYNPRASENRCQHTIDNDDLPEDLGGYCCYRPVWEDQDKCIWHAIQPKKPIEEIRAALRFESWLPEKYTHLSFRSRLDETQLDNFRVEDGESVNISNCTMANSDFSFAEVSPLIFQNVILSGSTFENANLEFCHFQSCILHDVDFQAAQLHNAHCHSSDFQDADLMSASLNGSNLYNTNLRFADLRFAELLDGVYLHDADCTGTNFEEAQLEGIDLRDTDLADARFHETLARSVRLSEATKFGEKSIYERESDELAAKRDTEDGGSESPISVIQDVRQATHRFRERYYWDGDNSEKLTKSIRVYRLYQRLLRENSLPDDIRHFRIRERHARRKLALAENRYLSWLNLSIQRWTSLYGESPWHVIATSLIVIFLGAILYPLFGVREVASETIHSYGGVSVGEIPIVFAKSIYFSTSTFTTLGYGDVQPTGWGQAVATVESFIGAILIALLVFVFSRQATW
ncbi:pentapeptide repeat-containing protein [Halobacteria archaeon HArc-gm2]|nr:pentapeptide repeat-containing protein [Halobacteria archaeon HArc-gm2]